MIKNFDVPKQVAFYDSENDCWDIGIGYNDVIICAECGAVIPIEDIYAKTLNGDDLIAVYDSWVNFSETISE